MPNCIEYEFCDGFWVQLLDDEWAIKYNSHRSTTKLPNFNTVEQ